MAILGFGKDEDKKDEVKERKISDETSDTKKHRKEAFQKEEKKEKKKRSKKATEVNPSKKFNAGKIILSPRITEKSTILSDEDNAYTFNVHPSANKKEIEKAVEKIYEVKPLKVNIINQPRKRVVRRGKVGFKSGGKKAIVYLREGDKIEFV